MRAKSRSVETYTSGDSTIITRVAHYKDGISTIEKYFFNSKSTDIESFPVRHSINVINGDGKLLQYEVQKLKYDGETKSNIKSPQSFGNRMKVEWEDGNYYSKIYKYKASDHGKLTVKYRIDSDDYLKDVRLFDPLPVVLKLQGNTTDNTADLTFYNSGITTFGFQTKWNISSIPENSSITDAKFCMYIFQYSGSVSDSSRVWRVDDQTWNDSSSYTLLAAQSVTNQSDKDLSSTTNGAYSCINVTDIISTDFGLDNTYSTIRVEDIDALVTIQAVKNALSLVYGNLGGNYIVSTDKDDIAGAGNKPYLNITYLEIGDSFPPEVYYNNIAIDNLSLELGAAVNLSFNITGGINDGDLVCVDIDHPEYGENYTCGSPNGNFTFNISYFRNDEFNDSTTQKNYSFDDFDDYSINAAGLEDPSYWEPDHLYTLGHDGDWATYAMPDTGFPSLTYYVNYLIPPNINQSNVSWTAKDSNTTSTMEIPSICVNSSGDGYINLSVLLHHGFLPLVDPHIEYSCYNGTAWEQLLDLGTTTNQAKLYEEIIVWDVEPVWTAFTGYFGFIVNKLDELYNVSINITGADNNGSSATNVKIKINDTVSNTISIIMEAEEDLKNITESDGGFIEEDYWPIWGNCTTGTYYTSSPCTNTFDHDLDTFGQISTSTTDIFLTFIKPDSAIRAAYINSKSGNTEPHYCYNSTDWLPMGSETEQDIFIPTQCFGAAVDNVSIWIDISGTLSIFYESYMKMEYDGSNATFQLDSQSTRGASLKLPKYANVSEAIFSVYGSESEEFNDQITATEFDGQILASSLQNITQSFIPENENLEAIWIHGAVGFDQLTVHVGTTLGGSDISSDTITYGYNSGLGGWVKFDINDSVLTVGDTYYITITTSGDILSWEYSSQNPYSSGTSYVDGVENASRDFLLKTVSTSLPTDPKISIGPFDSDYEWSETGNYSGDSTSVDLAVNLTDYLTTCSAETDGYCYLPFNLLSSSPGKLRIYNITIKNLYNPNPIYLDMDILEDFISASSSGDINVPITITTDSGGNITINDVRIDYIGGNDTINVLAWESLNKSNNKSVSLINYFSNWDYDFPENIDWLEIIPRKPIQDNVTPYGQSTLIPILNITNKGYGGMNSNFSVYLNESNSCVNLTISTTSNKTDGFSLNNSWNNLFTDVAFEESNSIWMWADYNCNYTTWKLWQPALSFRNCCVDCICSEDLS